MRKLRTSGELSWADGNASASQKMKLSDSSAQWNDIFGTEGITSYLGGMAARQKTSEKNAANGYAGLDGSSKLDGTQMPYGTGANTVCEGNDSRLTPAVSSVFTRTGAVVAAASDYDASQVDNDSLVTGSYVSDALNTLNAAISALSSGYARRAAVIDYVDCLAAPPTEVTGDRYILNYNQDSPGTHAGWDGAAKGDIVEFNGSTWDATTPEEGWVAYVDLQNKDIVHLDDGTATWEFRPVYSQSHADLTDVSANQHHNQVHDLAGSDHNSATLSEFNAKISDATLGNLSDTAPADVDKDTAAAGTATDAARRDHKHSVSTAVAGAATPGDSAAEGTATSLARSDHKHSLPAFGTGAGTFCEGNDSRLSDARVPTQHDIDSATLHSGVSGATEDNFMSFNANGLPKDSGKDAADFCEDKFTEKVFLHVKDMIGGYNAPAALSTLTGSTSGGATQLRKFASDFISPLRSLIADWQVPVDIVAADGIKFSVVGYITETTTPASGEGVVFLLRGASIGTGDNIDVTMGTAVKSEEDDLNAVGCTTQKDRFETTQSGTVTITNLAAGESAMLRLERDTEDANDDYGQDVGIVGIWIEYNRKPTGVA